MILEHGSNRFEVGNLVAERDSYRVYACKDVNSGQLCLLQAAAETRHNGGLERAAYVLKKLGQKAAEVELKHAERGGEKPLSYERLFPVLVDGFATDSRPRQRVNVLGFAEVDDINKLVPLSNLAERDHLRVALSSSAWIMGRMLKLLPFAHDLGIAVRTLSGNNILLEPSRHFALVFDWSAAMLDNKRVPQRVREADYTAAAQAVLAAIGANPKTGEYPYDSDVTGYVEFLWQLASGRKGSGLEVHQEFYALVDSLWGREFRKFQTLPL